ncbi:unnamed protein product [Orchesella dallaii]|uniref:Uncharacterized protein n=1 Tax=Orchesella dallaii TaxID=48710 RepID=A0ABP1PVE1_9HEXA
MQFKISEEALNVLYRYEVPPARMSYGHDLMFIPERPLRFYPYQPGPIQLATGNQYYHQLQVYQPPQPPITPRKKRTTKKGMPSQKSNSIEQQQEQDMMGLARMDPQQNGKSDLDSENIQKGHLKRDKIPVPGIGPIPVVEKGSEVTAGEKTIRDGTVVRNEGGNLDSLFDLVAGTQLAKSVESRPDSGTNAVVINEGNDATGTVVQSECDAEKMTKRSDGK